jgi:hypothetical protein
VVAKRNEVNARIEKGLGIGSGNAANFGGVLSVCNAKINFFLRAERSKLVGKIINGNVSNNVTKGKNTHRCAFLFCVLFFLEEFDLLAYGANAKADASRVGDGRGNADVGGLHGNQVTRRADGLNAFVNALNRESKVTERALTEFVLGIGEDLHHTAANVDHSARQPFVGLPFTHDGHTEESVIKMYGSLKMLTTCAFNGDVMNAFCQTFHKSSSLRQSVDAVTL